MDEEGKERIRCGSCLSYNDGDARYCSQCGRPLGAGGRPAAAGFFRAALVFLAVAGGIAGGYLLFKAAGPAPGRPARAPSLSASEGGRPPPPPAAAAGKPGRPDRSPDSKREMKPEDAALSPDALLEKLRGDLFLWVGMNRKGDEIARCAAVMTADGLALPARFLKGVYMAWVRGSGGGGFEVKRVLYYDELLGSALVRPEGARRAPGNADPASLDLGQRIYQIRPETTESRAAIVPGTYGGRSWDENTGAERHLFMGAPAGPLGSVIADDHGRFLGLAPPGKNGEAALFIPAPLFAPRGREASMSFEDFNKIYYEGTFEDFLERARSLVERGNLPEALDLYDAARRKDPRRGEDLGPEILGVSLKAAEAFLEKRRPREALDLLAVRSPEFPFSTQLALTAFRAAVRVRDFSSAAGWMERIRSLDAGLYGKLEGEHVDLYLAWSESLAGRGQRRDAIRVVREGIGLRPRSAALHERLGKLLKSIRRYKEAAAAFLDALRLDPDRSAELQSQVSLCIELEGAPGAVAINFDPHGEIHCHGLLDGKVWVDFIVDTGASYTTIPTKAAESLGIDVSRIKRKARVSTANGEKEIPYILLGTLDVSGFVMKQDFVLVNDLPHPDEKYGLLGLNFLNRFHYTVDHDSGRMVLKRK